jgi:hypothetical protein
MWSLRFARKLQASVDIPRLRVLRSGVQLGPVRTEEVRMKRLMSSLAIAAITLVAPRPAAAASLIINDALLSESIAFTLNDFEGGFALDGAVVQRGLNNAQTVTVPETDAAGAPIIHRFSADWITASGGVAPSFGVIAFAEGAACCSDILTFNYSQGPDGGFLFGTFESDAEPGLLALPAGATVVSEATPFVFNSENITASATSDVDAVPAVPEPASLVLLGTGLFAAVSRVQRRRSTPHR